MQYLPPAATRRTLRVLLPIVSLFFVASCSQTLWVYRDGTADPTSSDTLCKAKRIAGIPFFAKVARYEHVSVWQQSWKRVTLEPTVYCKLSDGKYGQTKLPVLVAETCEDSTLLDELRSAVAQSPADPATIRKAFARLQPQSFCTDSIPWVLVSNRVDRTVEVDYGNRYYLNAPLPWFGNSNSSVELTADGTLGKASASVETKLAEGISTLLPVKETLTALSAKTAPTAPALAYFASKNLNREEPSPPQPKECQEFFALTIENVGRLFEFGEETPAPNAQKDTARTVGTPAPIPAVACRNQTMPCTDFDGRFAVKPLPAAKDDKDESKTDGRKISVSGQIVLPDDSGDKKP